ncbi:bifunctional DNA primase/polymerase [Amycolatopsis magusensis]|uniref:bifunctional DNA primase/polymerase n=1 Tax=Amycolatopsis magusensis TaxID=882444 RepID=UPI0024A90000|nr:bifunctional DNA primase/polymerase [Amycolatopsis magusensis]MDI5980107.1 bifunctional DNA primase/polymerase [Amycolatopsis magusensis]
MHTIDTELTALGRGLRDWALYLAGRDWAVFPLHPSTKRNPAIKDWENRASTDPDRVRRAWDRGEYNIGLATGPSGLVVIDLDLPKPGDTGPDGATALAALAAERGGALPETWTVDTPSGGRHLYYRCPAGVRLRNTGGTLASCVDTRAWGGYVVAPGSVTDQGSYTLHDDRDPVDLPAWLVQACAERLITTAGGPLTIRTGSHTAYGAAALRGECDRVRAALPGQHNPVLASAAFTIGRKVGAQLIDPDTARAELIAAGTSLIGTEHWPPDTAEVERVVDAGLTAGARNPVVRKDSA